jgi:hypothetical protein
MSGYNCYYFCHDNSFGGSAYVSGTTCDGVVGAYTLNLGNCVCMDLDFPIITCDSPVFSGGCAPIVTPSVTPTNTNTPTNTLTPTQTLTPSPTSSLGVTPQVTPTQTSTPTNTPTATFTIPSSFNVCESTASAVDVGTYNRVTTFSGSSANFGYRYHIGGSQGYYVTGTAPDGFNYPIYQESVAESNFNTWARAFDISNTDLGWSSMEQATNPLSTGVVSSGSTIWGNYNTDTTGSIRTPQAGSQTFPNGASNRTGTTFVAFGSCPTPTPTSTSTPTRTPSVTPTNTTTPTNTPTATSNPECNVFLVDSVTGGTLYNYRGIYYLQDDGVAQAKYIANVGTGYTTTCGSLSGVSYSLWYNPSMGATCAYLQNAGWRFTLNNLNDCGDYVPSLVVAGSPFPTNGATIDGLIYPAEIPSGLQTLTYIWNCPSPTPTNSATPTKTPTVTPTNTLTPSPTQTSAGTVTLLVYAKYINTVSSGDLQYQVNSGTFVNIGPVSTSSCDFFYQINGLQVGDSVDFTDTNTRAIAGSTSVCPTNASSCNYSYSVLVTGTQYVYLTINGSTAC